MVAAADIFFGSAILGTRLATNESGPSQTRHHVSCAAPRRSQPVYRTGLESQKNPKREGPSSVEITFGVYGHFWKDTTSDLEAMAS